MLCFLLLLAFFILTLFAGTKGPPVFLYLSIVPGLLVSLVTPGYMLLRLLRFEFKRLSESIIYSVGASIFLLFCAGLLSNTILPLLGVSEPLATLPLVLLIVILNLCLLYVCKRRNVEPALKLKMPAVSAWAAAMYVVPPLFVIGSVMGVTGLNNGGSNFLAMTVLLGIGLYSATLLLLKENAGFVFPTLYFMTLALP